MFCIVVELNMFTYCEAKELSEVSLQPVKPTIISFLCPQFKPTIDVYKPLYKSTVVTAGLSSFTY